jgi:hypothetical protein
MTDDQQCPVCGLQSNVVHRLQLGSYSITCKRCGGYNVEDTFYTLTLKHYGPDADLSGVLRNRQESDRRELITISHDNYETLKSSAPAKVDVPAKVRYLLRYVARKSNRPGMTVHIDQTNDCSVCFAADTFELHYYFRYAIDVGYIKGTSEPPAYEATLTPKGWEEATRTPTLDSPNAFVAMCLSGDVPHADLLKQAFSEAITPAIEKDAFYHVVRIDQEQFNSDIVFEIIAQIKESRFVLADVTEHRHGVYFEGGYAMGMGLPVIWMCHESDLMKTHFDTSHLNHIVWTDDLSKLRKDLANRILATIGIGPKRPT